MTKALSLALVLFLLGPASFATERIVSVGGTITEIIYGLGLGTQVVGVDATSIYPLEVKSKAQLGYYRTISAEGVLSLNPSVVIMGSTSQNPQLVQQLRGAGIRLELIEEKDSLSAVAEKIERIGEILGAKEQGQKLVEKFNSDWTVAKKISAPPRKLRAMFLYARSPTQVMVAGGDTPAHVMMEAAGLENAFQSVRGFKPISAEALVQSNPDLVVLQDGVAGLEKALWDIPGMTLTQAGRSQAVVTVRTLPFLGLGPRAAEELGLFKSKVKEMVDARKN